MKILIYSPAFLPMVGGLENMAYMLAKEWSLAGMEITVVTKAQKDDFEDNKEPFRILRNPNRKVYWSAYLNADIVFFLNISLQGAWPTFLKFKPVFVSHQITYYNLEGKITFLEQVKRQLSRKFINISCSNFVRETLPNKQGFVIPNAYDSDLFIQKTPFTERTKDIVFVGRLVSDKGLDTLIKALAIIKLGNKQNLSLEVIGDGPELPYLKALSSTLRIESQIKFLGKLTGKDLAKKINENKIMVVPSKWKEPFGLVALEGLACGCKMIVSEDGGLKEATGGLGKEFENGCEHSLASAILATLDQKPISKQRIDSHLKCHTKAYIAQRYLSLFSDYKNR